MQISAPGQFTMIHQIGSGNLVPRQIFTQAFAKTFPHLPPAKWQMEVCGFHGKY